MKFNEALAAEVTVDEKADARLGEVKFRAPALMIDEFTSNKRRYPAKAVEAALKRITDGDGRTLWGAAGHPEGKFEAPDVSHIVDRLYVDGEKKKLMAEGRILPTTRGQDLLVVIKAGGKLGLSVRGTGTTKDLGEGKSEVNDDLRLAGVDFVLNPASPGAFASRASLYESADFGEISEDEKDREARASDLVQEARLAGSTLPQEKILEAVAKR